MTHLSTDALWSGSYVRDALGVDVTSDPGTSVLPVKSLVGLALRRNPKRAHLLVSRVLAKHVPTEPGIVASAGRLLGLLVLRELRSPADVRSLTAVIDKAADKLEQLTGVRPPTALCDVTDEGQVQAMFDEVLGAFGHLDVLMNNAGLGGAARVIEMSDEAWHKVIDVTLTGTMRCTRAALRHMEPRGAGAIVNNASVLGWRAQKGQSHYAAAKAGVMALTRCAAVEAADFGVRLQRALRKVKLMRCSPSCGCSACRMGMTP